MDNVYRIYKPFKGATQMTRQLIVLVLFLTINLSTCGYNGSARKDKNKTSASFKVNRSGFAILPFDTIQEWIFKDSKPAELTDVDLTRIEKLLWEFIDSYNLELDRQYKESKTRNSSLEISLKDHIIDLKEYKRQYVAVINNKGEKEVWVNCFCDPWKTNWRKETVSVLDGGNCYFNLKVNLTNGECYALMVNGDA